MTDVALEDGSIAEVRPASGADLRSIADFVAGLSERSVSMRFMDEVGREEAVRRLTPSPEKVVLLAERGGRVVGQAEFRRTRPGVAEVGVSVSDSFQGRGLGTALLGELADAAHEEGIETFEATMRPDNSASIKVLRDLGFPSSVSIGQGSVRVTFPTAADPETVDAFDRRDAIAAVSAMQGFFHPIGVAVIGAGRDPDSIGGRLFRNIVDGGYAGEVYPVNTKADLVQSAKAYRSVLDCPGRVDLGLVVVPAAAVSKVAGECAQKGVKGLVVISSGFAEVGKQGAALEQELLEVCRASGMRLIGPNCMGIVNTDAEVRLNAQFSPLQPIRGRTAFLSQSGAMGIAVIERANRAGLGVSSFVSVGNRADISSNDLLEYWDTDPNTDLVLLYLESFGNPRKFGRVARRVSRSKPILAVKSGRSTAGFRATQSHTGALLAASDVTVDALFRQAGVIRIDSLSEMFDAASVLATQPVPKGQGVAIITNAGGAGILAADAAESAGLLVPELSKEVQEELRSFLSPEAGVRNPVDMIASATAEDFGRAVGVVAKDPGVHAVAVLFVTAVGRKPEDVAESVLSAAAELQGRMPLVTSFVATEGMPEMLKRDGLQVPAYQFPEQAMRALAKAAGYGRWRERPVDSPRRFEGVRREEAVRLVSESLGKGEGWMGSEEAGRLLECYGVPVVRTLRASTPEDAERAASELGGRVVVKGVADGLVHKTEAGAVALDLPAGSVRDAAERMGAAMSAKGFPPKGFLVQPMVQKGVEMIVGETTDKTFGPLVACGGGGTLVELMKDVSTRLVPVTPRDASEMLSELRTYPLLTGYRGSPPCDKEALEEIIQRVSALADDIPEIIELDLNPVIVGQEGAAVVDFRVRLGERWQAIPLGAVR